ncbi:MAG TPA: shikimate dehydrogenase [Alphaproteobacteria bacterium]|nr:shikimate dehydrogenase [Alphaproteobacteria bacterium]
MLSGRAKLAGVMGWPVDHSRSPRLHGYWLAHYGIDAAYVAFPVAPENLPVALRALPLLGIAGVNLTVPHKEKALAAMDTLSPAARRIGAVNTVVVRDGKLHGDNTDGFGFLESVKASVPGWLPASGPATVIGAGGAARAILAALIDGGAPRVSLVNRSEARAQELANEFGGPLVVRSWADRDAALADAALLVNATTLGMTGQPPLDLALDRLPPNAAVCDIVYTPLETPLLAAARARGNPTIDGLGMLLHQARPGFEAWFGVSPAVTAQLRTFVIQGL